MNIKLSNGTELTPVMVTGGQKYVQGQSRDTLSFVFAADAGMETLDAAFTEAACESITIVGDDGTENIHKGYTIRAELSKTSVKTTPATESTPAVYEGRITVAMSQRTYAESQLAANTAKSQMLEECLVEMAGIVYA